MGKWKFFGGERWNEEEFVLNTCMEYDLPEEPDMIFHLNSGDLLTPGLVDFHCHIWAPPATAEVHISDQLLLSAGVFACADGGTFGYKDWKDADRFWRNAGQTEIRSMLNVRTEAFSTYPVPKVSTAKEVNMEGLAETFRNAAGRILGFKVALGMAESKEEDGAILKVAREAADQAGTRLAVHITNTYLSLEEIAFHLRPGDFLLHPYHGERGNALERDGTYSGLMPELQNRGINIDVGVGRGHFSWEVARAAFDIGFQPDIISSDQTLLAWQKTPFRNLSHILSGFVSALKMPLNDAFKAVTTTPAQHMGIQLDLNKNLLLLRKKEGLVQFSDSKGELVPGEYEYIPTVVIIKGKAIVVKE